MFLTQRRGFKIKGQYFLIGLISLLFVAGCQDEPADFGKDILPGKAFITPYSYDGHKLITYNVTKDSVRTDDPSFGILGYLRDPEFGISNADLLTQYGPGAMILDSAFRKDSLYAVDSLVLYLNYRFNWWYGDMFAKHEIKIYELTGDLYPSPYKYYSNLNVDGYYDPGNPLVTDTMFVNDDVPDSLWKRTEQNLWEHPDSLWNTPTYLWETGSNPYESHYWAFKLSQDLTDRLFDLDSATLADTYKFKNLFKGLYISSDPIDLSSKGSLVRIDMLGKGTGLKMYYHYFSLNEDGEITDTIPKTHVFPINVEAARVNRFEHDFENKIDFNDPNTKHLYVQGMAGSYARLDFPESFYNWSDSLDYEQENGLISHCRFSVVDMIIYVDSVASDPEKYPPPGSLTVYIPKKDKDGNYLDENDNIVDQSRQVLYRPYYEDKHGQFQYAFSNGTYDRENHLYYFNVKIEFLEYIMEQNADTGVKLLNEMYLAPQNPDGNFQRVILYGTNSDTNPIKFNIGYVKYY